MRAIFALAAILALAATPAAATTYDFIATSDAPTVGDGARYIFPTPAVIGYLSIPDDLVAAGSLSVTPWSAYNGPDYSDPNEGWPAGMTGEIGIGDPAHIPDVSFAWCPNPGGCPALTLTFDPNGTLSGKIDLLEETEEAFLGGNGKSWSGTIGSDLTNNWNVTGYWYTQPKNLPHPCCGHGQDPDPDPAPVPEPSSLALILPAIVGLVGLRRRLL